jgi:hypothetical protein
MAAGRGVETGFVGPVRSEASAMGIRTHRRQVFGDGFVGPYGPQRPDRIDKTGLDPPCRHHKFYSRRHYGSDSEWCTTFGKDRLSQAPSLAAPAELLLKFDSDAPNTCKPRSVT